MKLVLHIDRLVLHGVPARERDAVIAALRATLARELAMPGAAVEAAGAGHRAARTARFAPVPGAPALGREAGRRLAAEVRR